MFRSFWNDEAGLRWNLLRCAISSISDDFWLKASRNPESPARFAIFS